jgi:hypothetical protein
MADDLKTIVETHDLAAECRRLAMEVADSEISRKLVLLTDDLEQHIREANFGHRKRLNG